MSPGLADHGDAERARERAAAERAKQPPLAAVWRQDGVFVRKLSNFPGDLREAARLAGFTVVYIQLDHTDDAEANGQELARLRPEFDRNDWSVCGWSTFGQGSDAAADGYRHASIVTRLNLEGWVANGETWAEQAYAGKSRQWIDAWQDSDPGRPVAVSCLSSVTGNFARSFDFDAWLQIPGCAIMPQVYGWSSPLYTVNAALMSLEHTRVRVNRLNLTFDVGRSHEPPFTDYLAWKGPRSIWTGDDSTVSHWRELAR